ncbi:hypothetical protein LINPERPRIM_LOCUS18875, partial [Linum perenne]
RLVSCPGFRRYRPDHRRDRPGPRRDRLKLGYFGPVTLTLV